jgi:hypothetical protein
MTKHYTELQGTRGERIQFGAPRHDPDVFFLGAPPKVRIGVKTYELASIGTLDFALRSDVDIDASDDVEAIFEQDARVLARRQILMPSAPEDGVVTCRFLNRALDLDTMARDNAAAVAAKRAAVPVLSRKDVPGDYKIFCADTLDLMATMRHQIDEEIAPFAPSLTEAERRQLDVEMETAVADQWLEFLNRANSLVLPYKNDKALRLRMKRYTENVVTGEMCRGALQHRCYTKPLGYPGDFEIMNAFYDNVPRGDDTYSRLVDMLGLIAGRPVAKRMRYLTSEIEAMVGDRPEQDHFHVMSIGAGPAREFKTYFERADGPAKGFSITLVDPEARALDCAIRNIYSSIRTGVSSVMVAGMNTSFTEMLRPASTFRHLPPQDFIYSAGLTDYLNAKLTRALIVKLYDHLKPGGSVLIGNVNDDPAGMYWSAEYAVDWTMYFRNRADMEAIADGLPGSVELTTDNSGSYFMLKVTKPA